MKVTKKIPQYANIRNILLKLYGVTQSVDTVTRWGSTFVMIDCLLIFQDYCELVAFAGSKELMLTKADWDEIKIFRDILEKPNATTISLQAADIAWVFYEKVAQTCQIFGRCGGGLANGILLS